MRRNGVQQQRNQNAEGNGKPVGDATPDAGEQGKQRKPDQPEQRGDRAEQPRHQVVQAGRQVERQEHQKRNRRDLGTKQRQRQIDALPDERRNQPVSEDGGRGTAHAFRRKGHEQAFHDRAQHKQHHHLEENASRQRTEKAERARLNDGFHIVAEPEPVHRRQPVPTRRHGEPQGCRDRLDEAGDLIPSGRTGRWGMEYDFIEIGNVTFLMSHVGIHLWSRGVSSARKCRALHTRRPGSIQSRASVSRSTPLRT